MLFCLFAAAKAAGWTGEGARLARGVGVRIASQRRAAKGSGGSFCWHLAGQLAKISQATSRARTTSKALALPPVSN